MSRRYEGSLVQYTCPKCGIIGAHPPHLPAPKCHGLNCNFQVIMVRSPSSRISADDLIAKVVSTGAHTPLLELAGDRMLEIVRIQVERLCVTAGLNTAHDFNGVESREDIVLYLDALNRAWLR